MFNCWCYEAGDSARGGELLDVWPHSSPASSNVNVGKVFHDKYSDPDPVDSGEIAVDGCTLSDSRHSYGNPWLCSAV